MSYLTFSAGLIVGSVAGHFLYRGLIEVRDRISRYRQSRWAAQQEKSFESRISAIAGAALARGQAVSIGDDGLVYPIKPDDKILFGVVGAAIDPDQPLVLDSNGLLRPAKPGDGFTKTKFIS